MARELRFSTQLGGPPPGSDWLTRVRDLEAMGYGTILMPDHVAGGAWAPLVALAGASVVTTTARLGTLVIDNDFRNPLMLAREVATLDVLSNGRFELGIGAGWWIRDNESLGIPYDRGRVRVERLEEAVPLLKRFFTEEEVTHRGRFYRHEKAQCRPHPIQRPHPPFLIAGGGPRLLALAGREADIVAILGLFDREGRLRDPREATIDAAREKIGWVRQAAAERFDRIELSMFQDVVLTDDPERTIDELAKERGVPREHIALSIYRPIGTIAQVRAHILRLAADLHVTYFTLRGPHVDDLAPVVRELTGRPL
ncbi:MAG: TIGR03621 family F420-dependent LLM class oxidoreductase [Chloroflexi bacterium]|nr:TIGR03621 family F420-dependent LLM class oxidoreductase [Chloroflexota bacterium]